MELINYGKEMIRINSQKNVIEYSTNGGRSWAPRYIGSFCGIFSDLYQYGKELLACTTKGLYVSTNEGRSWTIRYTGSFCGTFLQLSTDGRYLLATTSNGLYCSTNDGKSWTKR
ncbi:MAG: hypothetical protein KA955_08930 [Prevotella sp.]|nr:hypothetical protein [Prevotella sp.]